MGLKRDKIPSPQTTASLSQKRETQGPVEVFAHRRAEKELLAGMGYNRNMAGVRLYLISWLTKRVETHCKPHKIDSKLTAKNVKTGEKSETSENNKKRPKETEKRKKRHTGACRAYPKRGK